MSILNQKVPLDKAYDTTSRLDCEYNQSSNIITVSCSLIDALTINNGCFKKIVFDFNLPIWTLVSKKGGRIEFQDNTFEFVGQSLSSLRKENSLLDLTAIEIHPFASFNLKITNGLTYKIINLLKKTSEQISSLAKSDSSVLYALVNLKSYAIEGDNIGSETFTDSYIDEKASMLYWRNIGKTNKSLTDKVEIESTKHNTHSLQTKECIDVLS